jgi:histidinol-phosphate aminotransferase
MHLPDHRGAPAPEPDPFPRGREHLSTFRPYHPGKPVAEVKREYGVADVVKLASNENALGASPMAKAAILASLDDVAYYPDTTCYSLRRALAAHLGTTDDRIVAGNGAVELIYALCTTYLGAGDEMVTGTPSFSAYTIASRIQDARVVAVPLVAHRFDLGGLARAIGPRTRLVFIANPNNPTGTIRTVRELASFLGDVPRSVLVVLDEAYHEFVTDPACAGSLGLVDRFANVTILRSLSKTIGIAGLRVGYGVARPEVVRALDQVQVPFHVNLLAQRAAIAALADRAFVERTLAMLAEGRAYLYRELQRLGLDAVPTHANFVFVDVGQDAAGLFERLLVHGVIVRPCDGFGAPRHIRVTIGLPHQNERFIRALEAVLQ